MLVRQFEALADYFEAVLIACPFEEYDKDAKYFRYSSPKITFIKSRIAGGTTISAKFGLVKIMPLWFSLYRRVNDFADIVYLRFPNNISIPALFYFRLKNAKMFASYAGSWEYDPYTSFSYRTQKKMLRLFLNGPVFIYLKKDGLHKKLIGSFSPSYSVSEWYNEKDNVEKRIECLLKEGIKKLKFVVIGALTENKNQRFIFRCCEVLKRHKIPFSLTVVGAGKKFDDYNNFLKQHDIDDEVKLVGAKNYSEVKELLREHDFLLHASLSEGFAKVAIEAMFHGCIPVLGNKILLAEKFIDGGRNGFIFNTDDIASLTDICSGIYNEQPLKQLAMMIRNARNFVSGYTLEKWAEQYIDILHKYFG